jgi:alkylation response protein AidB-like acyl-CoA dehydrogenase
MGVNYFKRDDRDAKFVLFEHIGVQKLLQYEPYKDFTVEDFNMILDESLKVCREVLGSSMQDGDQQGCVYDNGEVRVPASFHDCWKILKENGWMSLQISQEHGGQGLPHVIAGQVTEFFSGANLPLQIYTGILAGAGHLIETYGTEEDKALFCEKVFTGVWGGTMAMTEADAGSDVGYLRTKAVPAPEAGNPRIYKIEGAKRFISCGNHDLTENIIHLVLARIEGAPMGTRGISLFIVPKIWVNEDGSLGQPNDVFCGGIEHKMGIHGSATCTMNFGEGGQCRGILLGEPNSGMAKMFQLMNEARMGCGTFSLALAASAYDTARLYARERVQGPPFTNRKGERVPIVKHEDVRRMLMNLKAGTEAMRAMVTRLYFLIDVAKYDPDENLRLKADMEVELLTPLVKGYCADFGYELTRDAIQVLGGVGYCREFPVEQYARDLKSVAIYEGTTYIQALDLIGRKLGLGGGQVFQDWIKETMDFTKAHQDDPNFGGDFKLLYKAAGITADYAMRFMKYFGEGKLNLIPLNATRFLECFAETLLGRLMLEQGLLARDQIQETAADSSSGIFYRGKVETAHYFCRNIMTRVFYRHMALEMEDTSALDIPEEAF